MKKTGILMPVSALPSPAGVGELGEYAYQWIDILKENQISIWQILPLNPVGYGNSPYQPYSSCAGDELYISLGQLYQEGLLKEEPEEFQSDTKTVDYEKVRAFKEVYLRNAFTCFEKQEPSEEYKAFASQAWVKDYSIFRALKKYHNQLCWNEWPGEYKDWPETQAELPKECIREAAYQTFLQYQFFKQWKKVKTAANEAGIQIMGDVPFYVGVDSVDVWAHKENFLLDTDGRPIFIAGVPPDYFSATGQRWGNPIYDWDYMKKENYQFWVERIGYNQKLFDIIRIDHFRAFDTFWKIPAACPTAIDGEWVEAPGYEVLDTLKEQIPGVNLVAEDLGMLRPEVMELKNHYRLKGMKILVFSLDTTGKYARDIEEETPNQIIYTGTHDNDTLMEWYEKLSCAAKRKIRSFLKHQGIKQGSVKDRLLAYTLSRQAEFAIIPAADILGLGKEGHLNTPGTVGSPNWEWRMTDLENFERQMKHYNKMFARNGR